MLKTEREFKHFCGRKVDVKLYSAIDGIKEFCGTLAGYDENTACVKYGEKTMEIPVSQAVYIRLSFDI